MKRRKKNTAAVDTTASPEDAPLVPSIGPPNDEGGKPEAESLTAPVPPLRFPFFNKQPQTQEVSRTAEEYARLMQKAFERVLLPRKVKKLEQRLEEKDKEIKQLLREIKKLQGPDLNHSSILSMIICSAKRNRKAGGLKLTQRAIAIDVDKRMAKLKIELRQACPDGWRTHKDLPRLLIECLQTQDMKLRQLAKTLISRA